MYRLTTSLVVFATLTLLAPMGASAQQDVTLPVLLTFIVNTEVVDTTTSEATVVVTARVRR